MSDEYLPANNVSLSTKKIGRRRRSTRIKKARNKNKNKNKTKTSTNSMDELKQHLLQQYPVSNSECSLRQVVFAPIQSMYWPCVITDVTPDSTITVCPYGKDLSEGNPQSVDPSLCIAFQAINLMDELFLISPRIRDVYIFKQICCKICPSEPKKDQKRGKKKAAKKDKKQQNKQQKKKPSNTVEKKLDEKKTSSKEHKLVEEKNPKKRVSTQKKNPTDEPPRKKKRSVTPTLDLTIYDQEDSNANNPNIKTEKRKITQKTETQSCGIPPRVLAEGQFLCVCLENDPCTKCSPIPTFCVECQLCVCGCLC